MDWDYEMDYLETWFEVTLILFNRVRLDKYFKCVDREFEWLVLGVSQHAARTRFRNLNQLRLTYKPNQQILNFKTRRIFFAQKIWLFCSLIKKEQKSNHKLREYQINDQTKFDIEWMCKFNEFNDFYYVCWFE